MIKDKSVKISWPFMLNLIFFILFCITWKDRLQKYHLSEVLMGTEGNVETVHFHVIAVCCRNKVQSCVWLDGGAEIQWDC